MNRKGQALWTLFVMTQNCKYYDACEGAKDSW